MNIAFYLESLNENDKIQLIQEELTRNSDYISNASIFYNNIAPLQINLSAAIFHSSDLWSFEGVLIIDRISNLIKTKKIVNKFKSWYYYDKLNGDNFIDIINNIDSVDKIIANGEIMSREYRRLINKTPDYTVENYNGLSRLPL